MTSRKAIVEQQSFRKKLKTKKHRSVGAFLLSEIVMKFFFSFYSHPFLKEPNMARIIPPKNFGSLIV
jgi:predicted ABC-type sugar transport system permease subunit